jgi:hypothetical protein
MFGPHDGHLGSVCLRSCQLGSHSHWDGMAESTNTIAPLLFFVLKQNVIVAWPTPWWSADRYEYDSLMIEALRNTSDISQG